MNTPEEIHAAVTESKSIDLLSDLKKKTLIELCSFLELNVKTSFRKMT